MATTTENLTPAPALPRVRARRNPVLLAAGAALVVTGAAGVAWLVSSVADASPVLVTRHAIPAGEVLDRDDVVVAQVSLDPAVAAIPAGERDAVVGQRAVSALPAGQLLSPQSVTSDPVPAPGTSLVGVAVGADQAPAAGGAPGDPVTLVLGPGPVDDTPATAPQAMPATVAGARGLDDGSTVVDVTVPSDRAATLAGWVSTGRVIVIREAVTGP